MTPSAILPAHYVVHGNLGYALFRGAELFMTFHATNFPRMEIVAELEGHVYLYRLNPLAAFGGTTGYQTENSNQNCPDFHGPPPINCVKIDFS